jgi:uncharacterized protein YkwD
MSGSRLRLLLILSLTLFCPGLAHASALKAPTLSVGVPGAETFKLFVNISPKYRRSRPVLIIERAQNDSAFVRIAEVRTTQSQTTLNLTVPDVGYRERYRARIRTTKERSGWSKSIAVEGPDDGPPGGGDEPVAGCSDEIRSRVLELVNTTRALSGNAPLRSQPQLTRSAQTHSDAMALRGILSHDGWIDFIFAAGFEGNSIGENIAYGYTAPESVMRGWNSSPGHYANIVNPSFQVIGIGCTTDAHGAVWWVQNFGGY